MEHDNIMYLAGFKYTADTVQNYPSLVKIDIRVARENIMKGDNTPWQKGNVDGFLSAYGY